MNKKQYLITLLDALLDTWPLAQGLKTLVESNTLDDKTLDALTNIFKEAIKNVSDNVKKEKLQKSVAIIEKLKATEEEHKAEEAEDLEDMIRNV